MKLTTDQMKQIITNKIIAKCNKSERDQVMQFAFGGDYMSSRNKGRKVVYFDKLGE